MGQSATSALSLTIAVVAACRAGTFACEEDVDCADGGAAGICEAVGACSFVDDACPSGRRYGDRSPGDLAGQCVAQDGTSETSAATASATEVGPDATSIDPSTSTQPIPSDESGEPCPSGWWDCGWSRRIALDLPATATETFTEVPVLVVLGAPRIDPADLASGGADLRFVDADGSRVPHEIERWSADGPSIVWIAAPSLGPGDGPRLWLYYGNPAAVDDQDRGGVWSQEHAAVWHLEHGVVDASGHGNGGTASEGVRDIEGHLAGGKEFFAVDDRIDVPSADAIDDVFFAGGTVSAWVRPDTFGGTNRGRIVDKTANAAGGWMFYLSSDSGGEVRFRHGYEGGQAIWISDGDVITADTWTHVAATFSALEALPPRLYIDGVEQPVVEDDGPPDGAPVTDVGLDLVIGNSDVPDRWFDGRIDELRVERTIRDPAWIELQYRSMTDALVVYSAPEQLEDLL